jgi:hypothetical protein
MILLNRNIENAIWEPLNHGIMINPYQYLFTHNYKHIENLYINVWGVGAYREMSDISINE